MTSAGTTAYMNFMLISFLANVEAKPRASARRLERLVGASPVR